MINDPGLLSLLAALLNPKLSVKRPAEAVRQAMALYREAQHVVDPTQLDLAAEKTELQAKILEEGAEVEKWCPPGERITIQAAFNHQDHYKKHSSLERGLRRAGLVIAEQRCVNVRQVEEYFAALSRNTAMIRENAMSKVKQEPEVVAKVSPIYETVYWTSRRATAELFRRMAARAQDADRARKRRAKEPAQAKISENLTRKPQSKKRNPSVKKRNI